MFGQISLDAAEQLHTKLLVSHFATSEAQRDLGFIALIQKSDQITQLDLIVIVISRRPEFHFLDLNLLLLQLGFVLLLAFLVLVFAVIHDPTNRRLRLRRDFHQVQLSFFSLHQRFTQTDNTQLLAFHTHQTDRRDIYFAIDPGFLFLCYLKPLEKNEEPINCIGSSDCLVTLTQLHEESIQVHLTKILATPFANRHLVFLTFFIPNNDLIGDALH